MSVFTGAIIFSLKLTLDTHCSTNPCQGVSITFSTYLVAFMIVIVLQSVINGRP